MLKQRVITALILVAVLLPALFHPNSLWLSLLALVMVGVAFWEWCTIMGLSAAASRLGAVGVGVLSVLIHLAAESFEVIPWLTAFISLGWLMLFVGMGLRGLQFWQGLSTPLRGLWGVLCLVATWLTLVHAKVIGVNFLLSIFCLVWVADIGAYFSGRAWGRHKLAPTLSPGKSWEGVGGAVVSVLLLGWLWRSLDQHFDMDAPSIYTQTWLRWGAWSLLIWMLLLAYSVMGDLFESMMKRVAGVKDSSGLLPGHGGVLDRVDALLPALPLALWVMTR